MKLKFITMMIVMLILVISVLATVPALAGSSGNFCRTGTAGVTLEIKDSVKSDHVYARCFDNGVQLWRITCVKSAVLQTPVEGLTQAALDVDTQNPTGALRLYEKLDFEVARETITSVKKLN